MFYLSWILVPALLTLTTFQTDGKNVVFLPITCTSHTKVHTIVAEELAKLGHNVWVGVSSGVADRKTEVYEGVQLFGYRDFIKVDEEDVVSYVETSVKNSGDGLGDWNWIPQFGDDLSEGILQAAENGRFLEYVKSLKPDLIVIDWWPRINEMTAIPYALDVPFAVLSPLYDPAVGRVSLNPVAEAYKSPYFRKEASLYEQIMAVMGSVYPIIYDTFRDKGFINRLARDKPYITTIDVFSKAEIFIVEHDHIMDYPQPMLPNLKFVGGISDVPSKPLREPFKSFVERSEKAGKGIAVVSFGSLLLNLPEDKLMKIMDVLQQVKLNVVWRANTTSPNPQKILTADWIPQNDLVGHKNTKVFISHCGMHSQYEALRHGTPVVCVPFFFDQFYNAMRWEEKGFAAAVSLSGTSVADFVKTIEDLAFGDKIRSMMKEGSRMYNQLYPNPRKEAAFWLDHVMQYGGSYMRYSGQKIPWRVYVLGEFYLFFAGIAVTLVSVVSVVVLRCLCRCFCTRAKHVKTD